MHLSDEAVFEFKEICREEFGVELSDEQTECEARRVLSLFWLVLTNEEPDTDGFDSDH